MTKNDSLIHSSFVNLTSPPFEVYSDATLPAIRLCYCMGTCRAVHLVTCRVATDRGCSCRRSLNALEKTIRCVFVQRKQHMFRIVRIIGGCGCRSRRGAPILKKSFSPFPLPRTTAGYRNRAWQQTAYSLTLLLLSDCLALEKKKKKNPLWFTPSSKPCLHLRRVNDTQIQLHLDER